MSRTFLLCVLLLSSAKLAGPQDLSCTTKPIRVTVTDGRWRTLSHLKIDNFAVQIHGRPIAVASLERDVVPKRLAILLDGSGSMRSIPKFQLGSGLATELVKSAPAEATVSIFIFSVNINGELSGTREMIIKELESLQHLKNFPRGRTAVLDSLLELFARTNAGPDDLIFLLTDGEDRNSEHNKNDVTNALRSNGTQLCTVLLPAFDRVTRAAQDGINRVTDVTDQSGGCLVSWKYWIKPEPTEAQIHLAANALLASAFTNYRLQLRLNAAPEGRQSVDIKLVNLPHDVKKKHFRVRYQQELPACLPPARN